MLDATSLDALQGSFPVLPKTFDNAVILKMHSPRARQSRSAAIQRAGYIGCFAFGEWRGVEIVLRLEPGTSLENVPVGEAPRRPVEGMTFSPDLRHWVAGRLAAIEVMGGAARLKPAARSVVERAASRFGGEKSAVAVLKRIAALSDEPDVFKRSSALWLAAGKAVPLFQSLALAWSTLAQPLQRAVNSRYPKLLRQPILPGIYVALNTLYQSDLDLERAAWQVVSGDVAFDFTYNGLNMRPGLGDWTDSPLLPATRALKLVRVSQLEPNEALSLKAARSFAKSPRRYDGHAHLEAARGLAKVSPVAAFVHARNAAAFHARSQRTVPREALRIARRLAEDNGWTDLALLLRWAE